MEMIYSHPLMPEMIASFPIVSVDGTLEKRMSYSSVRENGHFKTGSLKHVNAIAGYFVDQSMDKKIFIFIMNDPKANQSQLLQQELINLSFQSSY
jgi:D-alanyl-D-alanine carboxypeptidase/D-alanyl-D-alanine-endopeptidase (penicillin-binding protein 4)